MTSEQIAIKEKLYSIYGIKFNCTIAFGWQVIDAGDEIFDCFTLPVIGMIFNASDQDLGKLTEKIDQIIYDYQPHQPEPIKESVKGFAKDMM